MTYFLYHVNKYILVGLYISMKFQINPNLNLTQLKLSFQKNKKLTIENFLTDESADTLHRFFASDMPEEWWVGSFLNFPEGDTEETEGYGDVETLARTPGNSKELRENLLLNQKKFLEGRFSYFFDRTEGDHVDNCDCVECEYRKFVASEETIKWFSELIDDELSETGEFFASRFSANHFLSPHHDHEKGKIATVLNLSKDWKPEWGGCLHFMEDDYKTVTKIVQPSFNKLSLFDVPTSNGIPHYVSHVTPGCKFGRISFTGWYL